MAKGDVHWLSRILLTCRAQVKPIFLFNCSITSMISVFSHTQMFVFLYFCYCVYFCNASLGVSGKKHIEWSYYVGKHRQFTTQLVNQGSSNCQLCCLLRTGQSSKILFLPILTKHLITTRSIICIYNVAYHFGSLRFGLSCVGLNTNALLNDMCYNR